MLLDQYTTLDTFRRLVVTSTGRQEVLSGTNDEYVTLVDAAINWAALLAAMVFKPQELNTNIVFTLLANYSALDICDSAYKILRIRTIYGGDYSTPIYLMSFDRLIHLTANRGSSGTPKYAAQRHKYLYFDRSPANNYGIVLNCDVAPQILSGNTDALSFAGYDAFITSAATRFTFASLEEDVSANIWGQLTKEISEIDLLNIQEIGQLQNDLNTLLPMSKKGE